MKLNNFFVLFVSLSFTTNTCSNNSSSKMKLYQNILINNQVATIGHRPCEDRYKAIKPILDQYKRPFTILDIGAAQGYFSLKTAYDYDATCVMIDGYTEQGAPELIEICKKNTQIKNVLFLKKLITLDELKNLSNCEHFDVVLALSVLHHQPNWKEFVDTVFKLGDNVIIENPSYSPKGLEQLLSSIKHTNLGTFPRIGNHVGRMRWYVNNKNKISDHFFSCKEILKHNNSVYTYHIKSNFQEKLLLKIDKQGKIVSQIPWLRGINLCTFKLLNGVWPDVSILNKSLLSENSKNRINNPFNLIIQGYDIKQLKNNSLSHHSLNYDINTALKLINLSDSSQVKNFLATLL